MAEINLKTLTLAISEIDVNFNGTLEGQADATIPLNVNLTDGVSDITPTSVVLTGNDLDITIVPSGVLFKKQIPTQYTSYRTGDVGDRVQTGWYNYTPPVAPKAIAQLDYTSPNFFSVLKSPLTVGGVTSTTRFVDVDGGQTWSATGNKNLATIDKLKGLMYTKRQASPTGSWNTNIDNALSYSVVIDGVTYDDWYLMSVNEILDIFHNYAGVNANVDPATGIAYMDINTSNNITTSNTNPLNTAQCWYFDNSVRSYSALSKASTGGVGYFVRKCENLITAP
jgi:hypothetical protein